MALDCDWIWLLVITLFFVTVSTADLALDCDILNYGVATCLKCPDDMVYVDH